MISLGELGARKSKSDWQLHSAKRSICGKRHVQKENSVVAEDAAGIFAVADGVGGYVGGAEASEFLCAVLTEELLECDLAGITPSKIRRFLRLAVSTAIAGMKEIAKACPELSRMGTTLALGWVIDNRLFCAHAGDSRVYLHRAGRLRQLTTDHSFTESLRQALHLASDELRNHPYRNMITRSIGPNSSDSRLEVSCFRLKPCDRLLFLTDGITNFVESESLERLASQTQSPEELCDKLLRVATDAGAHDDLSCVVVDCETDACPHDTEEHLPWWALGWVR